MNDFGLVMINAKRQDDEDRPSDGHLAVKLGFRWLQSIVAQASEGHYTLLMEDDARPVHGLGLQQITALLEKAAKAGADIVYFDDRHCQMGYMFRTPPVYGRIKGLAMEEYAQGATAYALTPHAAKVVLAAPF